MPVKKNAFICEVCGEGVPNNHHWRVWEAFIGKICKPCRLIEISEGIKRRA